MPGVIKEFLIGLGVDSEDAVEGLDDVDEASTRAATSLTTKLGSATATAGKSLAVMAAGAVAGGLAIFGLAKNAASAGAQVDDMAQRTGRSARELQRLGFAASQAGAAPELLAEAFKTLDVQLAMVARTGTGPAAEALGVLRLGLQDLQGLGAEEQFGVIADALSRVEDESTRNAAAIGLLGGAAQRLMPALAGGSAGLREAGDEAERLGLVLDDLTIAKAAALDDTLEVVEAQFRHALIDVGAEAIPIVSELAKGLSDFIAENRELIALQLAEFFENLVPLMQATAAAVVGVVDVTAELVDTAGGAENALAIVAGGLTAIKLAGLGIPGVMAAATLAIGFLASEAISEISGVNAELRRLDSQIAASKAASKQTARGTAELDSLSDLSYQDLAGLSDDEYSRRLEQVEIGINAAASASGNAAEGTTQVLRLRELLGNRRATGKSIVAAGENAAANVRTRERRAAEFKAKRAEEKRLQGRKPRGGGGGGGRGVDLSAIEDSGLAELVRNAGANVGASPVAIGKALEAAAAAVKEGAAFDVARERAVSVLESLTGSKVSADTGTLDPLLAELLGTDVAGSSSRAAIASTGLQPQTLINTVNNGPFTFDVKIEISGAGDPAAVAERIGPALQSAYESNMAATARAIEVTIKR